MSLPFTSSPNQNPSAGASAGASLITLRQNVATSFPVQRSYLLLPEPEIDGLCLGRPPFDVVNQFPRWIQAKHNNGESKLITLIEYYYKWLYCEFGSGYVLDDRISSITDIDETSDQFVPQIAKTYPPELELLEGITSVSTSREFIKNIRKVFYSSKGTKESIYHFFNTLFKNFVYVEISYPTDVFAGADTFRTNIGVLNDPTHALNEGSESTVSTDEMYEYSIKAYFTDSEPPLSEKEQRDIENLYRKLVHPVGMKLNFSFDYTNLRNID